MNSSIMAIAVLACLLMTGCKDGPMYAIKAGNPYYYWTDWNRDAELGVTDHERRKQLALLAERIDQMPAEEQQFWAKHLEKILDNDESPEMRRLAVMAAGRIANANSIDLIQQGLDDESAKVRMEACRALGSKQDEDASRILVATIGTDSNIDVQHAAIAALSRHSNSVARDSLKRALSDRNPATRHLAVQTLKQATGKDFGDDPQEWIAALEGKPPEENGGARIADRIREVTPF